MKKIIILIIFCILVVGTAVLSGCTSAKDDIAQATTLMNDGNTLLLKTYVSGSSTTTIDADMDQAASDYQQALDILTKAKTDNSEEKAVIRQDITICTFKIKEIEGLTNYNNYTFHMKKATMFMGGSNLSSVQDEIREAKAAANKAEPALLEAVQIAKQVDINSLPAERKTEFSNLDNLRKYLDDLPDTNAILDGLDHMISATEHIKKASATVNGGNSTGKSEIALAREELVTAKGYFDVAKKSKSSETSLVAIRISDQIDQLIAFIDQMKNLK